ncbi:MAG TPA: L,D-transpeptidase [Polyangiaceae bacterium]|nr:L,D-transpeptidase [Polyangiaceae bacterium]
MTAPARTAALALVVVATTAGAGRADIALPPWADEVDLPVQPWARSVVAKRGERGQPGDLQLFAGPSRQSGIRGLTAAGASLPFFGAKRGSGCSGRWWLVGPLAWTCSDDAEISPNEPTAAERGSLADSTLAAYFFVRAEGASAFVSLESAENGAPDRDLEGGWAVAIVEQRMAAGETWGRTSHGFWIAMRDLAPARPSQIHGEAIAQGRIDFGWVLAEHASVYGAPTLKGKLAGVRDRFERIEVGERSGAMVRVGESSWMLARDLAIPTSAAPPAEIAPAERWIDVDLASQTLVAYEGTQPVYATLVSTGRGPRGTGGATPTGVHRIWVKIKASDMDNVERGELDAHYSMEDVPNVQFFDGAVGLHGTYWHSDFGHVRSHGCVNLSPLDARWMFAFTEPHLPPGWAAAYPTALDAGTVVRVR